MEGKPIKRASLCGLCRRLSSEYWNNWWWNQFFMLEWRPHYILTDTLKSVTRFDILFCKKSARIWDNFLRLFGKRQIQLHFDDICKNIEYKHILNTISRLNFSFSRYFSDIVRLVQHNADQIACLAWVNWVKQLSCWWFNSIHRLIFWWAAPYGSESWTQAI